MKATFNQVLDIILLSSRLGAHDEYTSEDLAAVSNDEAKKIIDVLKGGTNG